jgi:hypothetical protein
MHDAGVDANTLSLVDEMEVLEALALEFLLVVAFLAYSEVVVAFLAESIVDGHSNMGAHFIAQCFFFVMCLGLLLVLVLRVLVVAFLAFMLRILKVDVLTFIIVLEVCI